MARLFGTDGVRGIANGYLNAELAYKLGRAAALYFGREVKSPTIIIGRDTRLSGTMLESALAAGICSAGGNAHMLGVIPTPAVSYLTEKMDANAGVVISASHNPFEDNGIKFFANSGFKLPDARIFINGMAIIHTRCNNKTVDAVLGKNIVIRAAESRLTIAGKSELTAAFFKSFNNTAVFINIKCSYADLVLHLNFCAVFVGSRLADFFNLFKNAKGL